MFSLFLAQASTSIFDNDVVKGAVLVFGLGFAAWLITTLRDLRKNITAEVRMQMREDEEETAAGRIPQPLAIKAHIDFTPYNEHKELKNEFEKLRDQRRADVSGLHTKIEHGLQKTRDDLAKTAGEIGKLQVSQAQQTNELHAIREEQRSVGARIDAMPQRLIQTLKDTKGLI